MDGVIAIAGNGSQIRPYFMVRGGRIDLDTRNKSIFVLGRGSRSDVKISGGDNSRADTISRQHATLQVDGSKFYITVNSTNGLKIDDSELKQHDTAELFDGNALFVGNVEVATFHVENGGGRRRNTSLQPQSAPETSHSQIPVHSASNSNESEGDGTGSTRDISIHHVELNALQVLPTQSNNVDVAVEADPLSQRATSPEIIELDDGDDNDATATSSDRPARIPRPFRFVDVVGDGMGTVERPIVLGIDSPSTTPPPPPFPVFNPRKRAHSDDAEASYSQVDAKPFECTCKLNKANACGMADEKFQIQTSPVAEPVVEAPPVPTGVDLDVAILNCSICLDICHNSASVHPCNHKFCHACILEWNERQRTCPQCRQKLVGISRDNVFDQVIEAYLTSHPESRRDPEDLAELDIKEKTYANAESRGGRSRRERRHVAVNPTIPPTPPNPPHLPQQQQHANNHDFFQNFHRAHLLHFIPRPPGPTRMFPQYPHQMHHHQYQQ